MNECIVADKSVGGEIGKLIPFTDFEKEKAADLYGFDAKCASIVELIQKKPLGPEGVSEPQIVLRTAQRCSGFRFGGLGAGCRWSVEGGEKTGSWFLCSGLRLEGVGGWWRGM